LSSVILTERRYSIRNKKSKRRITKALNDIFKKEGWRRIRCSGEKGSKNPADPNLKEKPGLL